MKHHILKYILLFILFCSCSTIKVNNTNQLKAKHHTTIGALTEQNNFLLKKDFNLVAFPKYSTSIKIKASKVFFNKALHKQFLVSKTHQNSNIDIKYSDSLNTKPYLIQLDISDRVEVIHTLNKTTNSTIFNYLKNNNNSNLVTSISVIYTKDIMNRILDAENIYLINDTKKNYQLALENKKGKTYKISLSEALVLSYNIASPCWKQNKAFSVKISGLVNHNNKCSNKSYKSSKKASRKINLFKL